MITFFIFIFTLSILVVFHEFGHYIVARLFKVKVLTFSVGFGPKLFKFNTKSNEWCIGAIPLGGYVKMLDEREGEVPNDLFHLAFNRKKSYQKILIASAGPIFNLFFAFIAYYFLALSGISELKPVVASVNPTLNSQISIPPQSIIKQINSVNITSWENADKVFNQQVNLKPKVEFNIITNAKEQHFIFDFTELRLHYGKKLYLENLGLYPFAYLPVISNIEPDSAAARAKLQIDDRIVAINGQEINNWFTLAELVQHSPGRLLDLSIIRHTKALNLKVIPDSWDNDGQLIGKLGIMPTLDQDLLHKNSFVHHYSIVAAAKSAALSTYNVIFLNLDGLIGITSGGLSVHDLGGPISIARASSSAFSAGFKSFIDFLALISIGLAIMNLLPIPVLDGGHIFIYSIEWLIGREITYQVQAQIFKIGFILLLGITFLAIYNDILRL